jgi:hypothetical protein
MFLPFLPRPGQYSLPISLKKQFSLQYSTTVFLVFEFGNDSFSITVSSQGRFSNNFTGSAGLWIKERRICGPGGHYRTYLVGAIERNGARLLR